MKTPFAFQEAGIELGIERNMLLNDACGLGKTLQAVEVAKARRGTITLDSTHVTTLVVCLKRARHQWFAEIIEQEPKARVCILDTDGFFYEYDGERVDYDVPQRFPGYIITHYENVVKWQHSLVKLSYLTLIVDEAHYIKNRKTKRSLFIKQLDAQRKMALTATPMDKRPTDYWSIINWLYPDRFTSFWKFGETYEDVIPPSRWKKYPDFVGPRNLDQLAREIGPFTLARKKRGVLPDLPPRIFSRIEIPLDGQQKKLYDRIATAKDLEVTLEDFKITEEADQQEYFILIKNVLSKIIKLMQVGTDPLLLGVDANSVKLE